MKLQIQLTLILVLVVLMYYTPLFLTDIARSPLGKLILISGVLGLSYKYGRNTGIISALIVLLLLHNYYEGLENKNDAKQTDKNLDDTSIKTNNVHKKEGEGEEGEEGEGEGEEGDKHDQEASQEKEAADKTTNTIVANEESMRPKPSNETLASNGAGPSSEPMAMPTTTTEGFALLN